MKFFKNTLSRVPSQTSQIFPSASIEISKHPNDSKRDAGYPLTPEWNTNHPTEIESHVSHFIQDWHSGNFVFGLVDKLSSHAFGIYCSGESFLSGFVDNLVYRFFFIILLQKSPIIVGETSKFLMTAAVATNVFFINCYNKMICILLLFLLKKPLSDVKSWGITFSYQR